MRFCECERFLFAFACPSVILKMRRLREFCRSVTLGPSGSPVRFLRRGSLTKYTLFTVGRNSGMTSVRIRTAGSSALLTVFTVVVGFGWENGIFPSSSAAAEPTTVVISTQDPAAKKAEAGDAQAAAAAFAAVQKKVFDNVARLGSKFTVDLSRHKDLPPGRALCGTRLPNKESRRNLAKATRARAQFRVQAVRALARAAVGGPDPDVPTPKPTDANFSWIDNGYVSSVKFQGDCGDCWNFAGIGVLESMYAIRFGKINLLDLSEQQVLDENNLKNDDGTPFSCCGGLWAFEYMKRGVVGTGRYTQYDVKHCCLTPPFPEDDAVPYTPSPSAAITGRLYKVDNWDFVGDADSIPSPDAIKKALCDHGPLISGVIGDDPNFRAYTGGIFNGDLTQAVSGGPIDHAVVIVGWTSDGCWIVKNSWGPDIFGVQGFIKMAFGANNIGYAAAWCEPAESVPAAQ
jgi:hypothetical protein